MITKNLPDSVRSSNWLKRELGLLVETVRKAQRDQANDLAATIAFWSFFSIFPLLIAILAVAGHFLRSEELKERIFEAITNLLPGSADLVQQNIEAMVSYRGTMSLVAIVGLLWSASKVFGAITRAVNRALGAKPRRSYLMARLRYFLMAVAVAILTVVAIATTVAMEIVTDADFLARFGLAPIELPRITGNALSFVLILLIFALIYKVTPYVEVRWSHVLPGAILAAVLFELGKKGFVLYLDRVAHLEAIYGSLSSIIVLLLWLYLSALFLIYGAEYSIVRAQARVQSADS